MRLFLLLALAALLTACSPGSYAVPQPATYADTAVETTDVPANRMVIRTASLSLRVERADSTLRRLTQLAESFGGYPASTDNTTARLRVPAARLDEALDRIAALGKVTDRRLSTEDITNGYRDLGIRLENAERTRQRYLALLERAETVTETLEIERELQRISEEVELLKARRLGLERDEALATVTVYLREREKIGPLGYVFVGLWKGISWLFVRP